jgi:transcriptional regulator with XRE-family HTH domain
VESHLNRSIAYQVRAIRESKGWTQEQFASELEIDRNNLSARLENPHYGKHTLTTLKKIAKVGDVALVVWFVPFSRMVDWVTGTAYLDNGLRPEFYDVADFENDQLKPEAGETKLDQILQSAGGKSDFDPDAFSKMLGSGDLEIDSRSFGASRDTLPKNEQQQFVEMQNAI